MSDNKFKGIHWSKMPNAEEIKQRILKTRENNVSYKEKIQIRMRGANNPSKIPEYRDKMIASKKASPLVPRGEMHHNWKGGITEEHNKVRGSAAYVQWRDLVYKRDRWTCAECKSHCQSGDIVAHHLKSFAEYKDLRFVIENGITLCRSCHAIIHGAVLGIKAGFRTESRELTHT